MSKLTLQAFVAASLLLVPAVQANLNATEACKQISKAISSSSDVYWPGELRPTLLTRGTKHRARILSLYPGYVSLGRLKFPDVRVLRRARDCRGRRQDREYRLNATITFIIAINLSSLFSCKSLDPHAPPSV